MPDNRFINSISNISSKFPRLIKLITSGILIYSLTIGAAQKIGSNDKSNILKINDIRNAIAMGQNNFLIPEENLEKYHYLNEVFTGPMSFSVFQGRLDTILANTKENFLEFSKNNPPINFPPVVIFFNINNELGISINVTPDIYGNLVYEVTNMGPSIELTSKTFFPTEMVQLINFVEDLAKNEGLSTDTAKFTISQLSAGNISSMIEIPSNYYSAEDFKVLNTFIYGANILSVNKVSIVLNGPIESRVLSLFVSCTLSDGSESGFTISHSKAGIVVEDSLSRPDSEAYLELNRIWDKLTKEITMSGIHFENYYKFDLVNNGELKDINSLMMYLSRGELKEYEEIKIVTDGDAILYIANVNGNFLLDNKPITLKDLKLRLVSYSQEQQLLSAQKYLKFIINYPTLPPYRPLFGSEQTGQFLVGNRNPEEELAELVTRIAKLHNINESKLGLGPMYKMIEDGKEIVTLIINIYDDKGSSIGAQSVTFYYEENKVLVLTGGNRILELSKDSKEFQQLDFLLKGYGLR